MKNKKMSLIIVMVLVMFVASVMLGLVAAGDTQEITIGSEKFKLPTGYEETESKELKGGTIVKKYENGDKWIKFNVNSGKDQITSVQLTDGEVEKEIAGINGAFDEEKNKFTYVSKDKKTTISVQCDSFETLEEFLKLNK